jgi:peptidoglycan/LPS O-acetylase OafA/YrhL
MAVSIPLAREHVAPAAAAPKRAPLHRVARLLQLELLDNRFAALHGMRVLAIVSVVQYHVTSIFAYEARLPLDRSWVTTSMSVFFGMDLFFVLSGFLIGSILIRSVETAGFINVRRFWLRRAFRTFPAYYVVLTFLVLALGLSAAQRRHLPLEVLYLTNYAPLHRDDVVMLWGWSLALEEQFYLSVPLLFFLLHKLRSDRARLALLGTFWLSALVVRLAIYRTHPQWSGLTAYEQLYFKTHTRFDTLVAGILLAYVQQRWHAPIARWLEHPGSRALLAMPSLACLWLLMQPWMLGEENVLLVRVFSWGTVTSIMYFGWVILLLNGGDGWIQRALAAPFWRYIATLGYGVYLVHIPLCDHVVTPFARALIQSRRLPMAIVWPLSVAALLLLSLAVAYVLHVLVEKPALRLRDRFAR